MKTILAWGSVTRAYYPRHTMAQEREQPREGRLVATAALSVGFPIAAWFFMGGFGLELGLFVVLAWLVVGSSRSALWGAAVGLLVLGMLALLFGGLPRTAVVGAQFGVDHLVAHRVVGAALAVGAFAGLLELMGLRRG